MRLRKVSLLLVFGLLFSACRQVQPSSTTQLITQPASEIPPIITHPLPATAIPSPTTALPTATFTPLPSLTPLPPIELTYYHLRVVFATTSDWSTLELLNPEHMLAARAVQVSPQATYYETGVKLLSLNQPLAAAEAGQMISITVDYALSPQALGEPLSYLLQKGALRGSTVEISVIAGEKILLQKANHQGFVESNTDTNPFRFQVFLTPLDNIQPLKVSLSVGTRPKMLWAFYYPWYTLNNWTSAYLQDRPLERYASSSVDAIQRHIQQAQRAGIDGFISSWWGPGSDTDQNLRKLLPLAEKMNFKVSIYFETLGGPDGKRLDSGSIMTWMSNAIQQYGEHPAFMRLDGKPLIVVWASGAVPLETWAEIFEKLRKRGLEAVYLAMGYSLANLEVFDGVHEYGVFTIPDLAQVYQATGRGVRFYNLLSGNPVPNIWVATVQPGYDDTLLPGREGLVQARLDGEFYRSTFDAAIASNPDWIFITSWNEWWEHTHIEPSELYGELYLEITRQYADFWKGGG